MYIIADGGVTSINDSDTIDAIMLSKNIDYIDGVKLDVYKSLDNIFVLCPSNELNEFTLSNKKVSECNYEYLKKVKFPSRVFKYYIPTLEEVLINYNIDKKIVLKIYTKDNLDDLRKILIKYPYHYFFITSDKEIERLLEINGLLIWIIIIMILSLQSILLKFISK